MDQHNNSVSDSRDNGLRKYRRGVEMGKPHCYGGMTWVLKYSEDEVPNESICKCQHSNSCWRLTWNKFEEEKNKPTAQS